MSGPAAARQHFLRFMATIPVETMASNANDFGAFRQRFGTSF
jgi:hypothetical protein